MYCENLYDMNFDWDCGELGNHSMSVRQSIMFDGEEGKPVKAPGKSGLKTVVSETKTMAALKSHSEAERRRRERINAHLDTLRGLVPKNEKMDKATLLAEVVTQVKQLKKSAAQASQGLHIPTDSDAVEVTMVENNSCSQSSMMKASLCCDYRPDLLANIKQAIDKLPVRILKCEISALGGRMKSVFFITRCESNDMSWESIAGSVRRALGSVLEKVSASLEYDQIIFPRKRQRLS